MLTESTGQVEIDVPRDRAGTFEPQIVRKRQRRLSGVDEIVLSLYAKGLTTGEISAHFAEIYGASVSRETISRITDKVIEEMNDWAVRPLDEGRFLANVANQVVVVWRVDRCMDWRGVRSLRHLRWRSLSSSATCWIWSGVQIDRSELFGSTGQSSSGSTGAAAHWCFRSCRAGRAIGRRRSRSGFRWLPRCGRAETSRCPGPRSESATAQLVAELAHR